MKIKKVFILINGVFIITFIAISVLLFFRINSMKKDSEWVAHTYEVIRHVEHLMTNMINQETGMRGYLATGNETYLEPYDEALISFDEDIILLKNLIGDNPKQVRRLERISKLSERWHTEASDVYLSIKKDIVNAEDIRYELEVLITSGQGKNKVDRIRKLAENIEDDMLRLNVLNNVINMETGVRAYIINEKEEYLEPYYQSRAKLDDHIKEANIPALSAEVNSWIKDVAETEIRLIRESSKFRSEEELANELSKGTGKALMDQIREAVQDFVNVELALLEERGRASEFQYERVIVAVGVMFILFFIVSLVQRIVMNSVSNPLIDLLEKMKRVDAKHVREEVVFEPCNIIEVADLRNEFSQLVSELKNNHEEREESRRIVEAKSIELEDKVIRLEKAEKELYHLTRMDQLTNVKNRRAFDETFDSEWRRSIRGESPLTLMMVDIDHFKNYNDTYGHIKGDECLRRVAGAISDTLFRPFDRVFRYGGEEFVVLLPETDSIGGKVVAEKIRKQIEELRVENLVDEEKCVLTVSIGISAIYPNKDSTMEALINHADQALYRAKELGRNRWEYM